MGVEGKLVVWILVVIRPLAGTNGVRVDKRLVAARIVHKSFLT